MRFDDDPPPRIIDPKRLRGAIKVVACVIVGAVLIYLSGVLVSGGIAATALDVEERAVVRAAVERTRSRGELQTSPSNFVHEGRGRVEIFDEGILNRFTQIRRFPVHNASAFDIAALAADVTLYDESGRVLATVPVTFEDGIRAGEDRVLRAASPTVKGEATRFELRVTSVTLWNP